jgi:protein arginine kinase
VSEKTSLPESILNHIAWDDECNPIWPASAFFLRRNIAHYLFPHKLDTVKALKVLDVLKNPLISLPELKNPTYLSAETLSPQEKEFLCEHFLSQEGWQNAAKGQAFLVDASAHFLATLNVEDHLLLQWIDCKGKWEHAWKMLSQIESSIGETIDYAFSPHFGYLTSNPKFCGTSLTAICYLHLPALIFSKKLEGALHSCLGTSVDSSGLFGDKEAFIGDFVVLRNNHTLGITEQTILNDLHKTATALILAEKNERLSFQKNDSLELKDQISRAYGLLMHSYQLETKEALNALSQIKLGINLGWIRGISDEEVNELFFRCRRAHLLQSHQKISLDKKELSATRAQYLHDRLRKTTCHF